MKGGKTRRAPSRKENGRADCKPSVLVVGRLYREVNCDCGVPPWEECKHSEKWPPQERGSRPSGGERET